MSRPSAELPGPPTCTFCGSVESDRYVGGYGNHVCRECICHPGLVDPPPPEAVCALCQVQVGSRRGGLAELVVVVTSKHGAVLCDACQRIAERILAEDDVISRGSV